MTISELIALLAAQQDRHGDLQVRLDWSANCGGHYNCYGPTGGVASVQRGDEFIVIEAADA